MLVIKKLTVENIGCLVGKHIFNFESGVNLIDGANGHGKTTLLSTIELLLLSENDFNYESIMNNKSDNAYAELEFEFNDKNYKSEIKLVKNNKSITSSKKLICDDNIIEGNTEVNKKLNELFPPTLTKYSLINSQKGQKITTISDSDRRVLLTQLCELDYSNKVKEIIENEIDNYKQIISDKEKEEYSLKNKQYNFGEEKEILIEWNNENEEQLNEFKEKQKLYEKNFELKKRISDLNYKVHDLRDDLERKKFENDINALTEHLNDNLELEKNSHEKAIELLESDFESNRRFYETNIKNFEDEITSIEKKLVDIKLVKLVKFDESSLINARNNYSELVTKSKIALKNAEQLVNGYCPICGSECSGKHDEFENEAKSLEKQSVECQELISDLENKKKEYESKKEENDKNKSLKENLTVKLESLKEKLAKEKESLIHHDERKQISIDSENKHYEEKIENINKIYEEKKNNAKIIIENAEKLYNDTVEELNSVDAVDDSLEDYTNQIKVYEKNKQNYYELVSYNNAIKENNEKLKKEQVEDKKQLEIIEKDLFTLKDKLSDYTFSKEIMLKTFPTWALEKISDSIVEEINAMIETIYDKSLNINFEANKNSLKMTYDCDGDRPITVLKLSGFEDNITNLSVQSTFNKRQGLNCILLDECDNFASEKNAQNMIDCLLNMSNIYNQMIIITHKKELKTVLKQNGCTIVRVN